MVRREGEFEGWRYVYWLVLMGLQEKINSEFLTKFELDLN
jgi:hypothetical protein